MAKLPKHLTAPPARELMRRLRKHAPVGAPIRLVQGTDLRVDGELVLGYLRWRVVGERVEAFRLCVDRRLPPGEKHEVIVHEWAHALDRSTRPRKPADCHDGRWGQCFARAFRASLER
jgi:hypothetical protein